MTVSTVSVIVSVSKDPPTADAAIVCESYDENLKTPIISEKYRDK
jgi:hypothetical protein